MNARLSEKAARVGRALGIAFVAGLVGTAAAVAQTPGCTAEHDRQFDFWIGDWDVTVVGSGQVAGTNSIHPILDGCVLHEVYETPAGYRGQSFNSYDPQTGQWHQTWVDNFGLVLKIDGGIVDGKMVLSGPGRDQQGNDIINRITWTPHDDGSVQQTWDVSADGGATWVNSFDGLYRKRGS